MAADPLRHTLHLYKTSGATQDLGGTAGTPAALSWSGRKPSGPLPQGFKVDLALGEITFDIPGRYLVLATGGIAPATSPTNFTFELQRRPKGGAFAAVDEGQKIFFNHSGVGAPRNFSLHSLITVRPGDTWRLVVYGSGDGPDVCTFTAAQMSIIGLGQVVP